MLPAPTVRLFDAFLAERGLTLDAVVVGGAALALLGIASRHTKDCDIIHPDLPQAIRAAAAEFASQSRLRGEPLSDDWLNNGPSSLAADLPAGWMQRLVMAYEGASLTLRSLGRSDLLKTKVFALCDRGIDLQDCIALRPTASELAELTEWLVTRDTNPGWPTHAQAVLADLGRRLGHGV